MIHLFCVPYLLCGCAIMIQYSLVFCHPWKALIRIDVLRIGIMWCFNINIYQHHDITTRSSGWGGVVEDDMLYVFVLHVVSCLLESLDCVSLRVLVAPQIPLNGINSTAYQSTEVFLFMVVNPSELVQHMQFQFQTVPISVSNSAGTLHGNMFFDQSECHACCQCFTKPLSRSDKTSEIFPTIHICRDICSDLYAWGALHQWTLESDTMHWILN